MRSSIRKRLGRTLAGVATVATAAALTTVFGGTAVAEDTPPAPSNEITAKVEADLTPGPSTQAESDVNVSVNVEQAGGDGSTFQGSITVNVEGDPATNVHLQVAAHQSNELNVSGPNGFLCIPGAEVTTCDSVLVQPGTYTFEFTGSVANPRPGKTVAINASVSSLNDSNQGNNHANATYTVPRDFGGTISGRVWNDTNKNGVQEDGEPGIAGVTVQAFDNNTPIGSPVTDGNGGYSFTGVIGDNVVITVSAQSDMVFTVQDVGNDVTDSDADGNGTIVVGEVGVGDTLAFDAGLHAPGGGGGNPTDNPTDNPTGNPTGEPTEGPGTPGPTGGVPNPSSSNAPTTSPAPKLPKTGTAIGGTLAAGAVMMVAGGALAVVARRRNEEAEEVTS